MTQQELEDRGFAPLRLDDVPAGLTGEAVPPGLTAQGGAGDGPEPDAGVWDSALSGAGVEAPAAAQAALLPPPGAAMRLIRLDELLRELGLPAADGPVDEYAMLAAVHRLARMGLALVPDARCPFRVKGGDTVAVIPATAGAVSPVSYRSVAHTVLYLAVWLVQHDAVDSDIAILDAWTDGAAPTPGAALAMRGMLRWLLSRRRTLAKRVKARAAGQMGRFARKRADALSLLLTLTAARPTPRRVSGMQTLLPLFGIDPGSVHSLLHRRASGTALTGPGPAARPGTPALDSGTLRAMERNTRQAQRLLGTVFADAGNDNAGDVGAAPEPAAVRPCEELLHTLLTRPEWSAGEFAALCRERGLLPGAALEGVNDLACELYGDIVADDEGDRIVIITPEA